MVEKSNQRLRNLCTLGLALCLVFFFNTSAVGGQACIDIEKFVSLDGGQTFVDADTCDNAPTVDQNAEFKLVVTNCGYEDLTHVKINDTQLGINNYFVGSLAKDETVTLDKNDIPQLFFAGLCDQYDQFENTAVASGQGITSGLPVQDEDPACVTCQPCIDLEKLVSVDGGNTFVDADTCDQAPTTDQSAEYQLVATNYGPEDLVNVVVNDTQLGINNYFIGSLGKDQAVILDKGDITGLEFTNLCDQFDQFENTAVVAGEGVTSGIPVEDQDPACVECEECALAVTKTCEVRTPPAGDFDCKKPIDVLTMIWDGSQDVRIKAFKGDTNDQLLDDIDNIEPGAEVSVDGYSGSQNDVVWQIFMAGTDIFIGESTFHLSCSDDDMDVPEDCGKQEGDGKGKSGFVTDWLLEGLTLGNGNFFDCTPSSQDPTSLCEVVLGPVPDCDTAGKPTQLTFKYTGGDCSATTNFQEGKLNCSGVNAPLGEPVQIVVTKDANKFIVTPSDESITVGDLVELAKTDGKRFPSETKLEIRQGSSVLQSIAIHTSCSKSLRAGDVFGGLELVAFNGMSAGVEVAYTYAIENIGQSTVFDVIAEDDHLGLLTEDPIESIASGETVTRRKTVFVDETVTNRVDVRGETAGGALCEATATATVEIVVPPGSCDDGKPKALVFEYTGDSCAEGINSQSKDSCSGDPNDGEPVSVVITKDANKVLASPSSGIHIGDLVTISSTENKFKSEIKFDVVGGAQTQSLAIHTSCSNNLIVGEQFGSMLLREFIPE